MNEAQFKELGEHLNPLRTIFEGFCLRHDFEREKTGLYPRIKINRTKECTHWFDFQMTLDTEGGYREKFEETVGYDLDAGAFFDVRQSSGLMIRYSKAYSIWASVPFLSITPASLEAALENGLPPLLRITPEQLIHAGSVQSIKL